MSAIEFVKAVASGNDFIIIDRLRIRNILLRQGFGGQADDGIRNTRLAKELCQRKLSVGADGLLLIEPSKKCDFKMRIFNPDGTEVDMCGNGLRCAALYAQKNKIAGRKMSIETSAGEMQAEVRSASVKIRLAPAKNLRLKFDLDIDGQTQKVNYINTGVPHVVCFVQGLDDFNVKDAGRAIRYHSEFQPKGTNADFVQVLDKGHIRLRTYERGVEQETLACGTGAVASAIITTYEMQDQPQGVYKLAVDTSSGERLLVCFNIDKAKIKDIFLEGKAKIVYEGGLDV
jgi:diaminopimelate epimerase